MRESIVIQSGRWVWKVLNSRKFALYLLLGVLFVLILSTFLPSYFTLSAEKWAGLERERPVLYWISSRFATPFIVKSTAFVLLSCFLFLSTLVCTFTRTRKWLLQKESEFVKDKAFSFSLEETSVLVPALLLSRVNELLRKKKWLTAVQEEEGKVVLVGHKGISLGFWGSVVFHGGLLLSFLAAPVTAFSVFRGDFIVTEGITVPLREGIVSHDERTPSMLSSLSVSVHDLEGVYEAGKYKVDFGGTMRVSDGSGSREYPFRVNDPVTVRGYQFTLSEFGFAPKVTMSVKGEKVFDYFLNLRNPESGDYFDLGDGRRLFLLFFPDFVKQGGKIWTKSRELHNPVVLIKIFEGERELGRELVPLGESATSLEPYAISFAGIRNWTSFIVVRDFGMPVLIAGFLIGVAGLLVRFLSNERRVEMEVRQINEQTLIGLSGYSRYYPAFLEKEVRHMADLIRGEH